jgi:hypothetical protein
VPSALKLSLGKVTAVDVALLAVAAQRTMPSSTPLTGAVLSQASFGLYYYHPLNLLACKACSTFITTAKLWVHLELKQHRAGLSSSMEEWHHLFCALSDHLISSFSLHADQTIGTLSLIFRSPEPVQL